MSLIPKDMTPVYKATIAKGTNAQRWQRPVYRQPAAAVQPRVPGGREHPGLARSRAGGALRGSLAEVHGAKPAARHARPGLLSPLRERAATGSILDSPVAIHSLDRFLGDLANEKGWQVPVMPFDRQARAGRRRRSRRAVVRLSPAAHGPRRRDPRCRAGARRHDALRDPAIPAPARRTDAGDRAHPGDGRDDRLQLPRQRRARREGRRALRRRYSSRSARRSAITSTFRRWTAAR